MINYSTNQNLKIPIQIFFQTVRRVRNYKNFVPWCKESFESHKSIKNYNYEQISGKFPALLKNKNSSNIIKELLKNENQIKIKSFDGSITVGFNILEFTYVSKVVVIEPNIVLSITDSSKSNVFKKLESIWVIKENKEAENIAVEYYLNFEFKSYMFSNVTNLFLDFLGENIVKSFIDKCNHDMENSLTESEKLTDTDFSEILDFKLHKIHFDYDEDRIKLQKLLITLHQLNKISIKDTDNMLKVIKYNKTFLSKLLFLCDIAVWNNQIQLEKIKNEIRSSIY